MWLHGSKARASNPATQLLPLLLPLLASSRHRLKPWIGSIHMWPWNQPPLAPLPHVRPPLPCFAPQPRPLWLAPRSSGRLLQCLVSRGNGRLLSCPAPRGSGYYHPMAGMPSWDQQALASSFSTTSLTPPHQHDWIFDSSATSHMTSDDGTLSHSFPRYPTPSSIVVGNGSLLPVTSTGTAHLPIFLCLNSILVSPGLIKNHISVRQFTADNNCSDEFDPAGCSVKDLESRRVITKCNSSEPLYLLCLPAAPSPPTALLAADTSTLWHRYLDHPGLETLSKLVPCNLWSDSVQHKTFFFTECTT